MHISPYVYGGLSNRLPPALLPTLSSLSKVSSQPLLIRLALRTMFCKAALIAVALSLMASANPVEVAREPLRPVSGVRIPLHKRNTMTSANGVFNFDSGVREVVKLQKCVTISIAVSWAFTDSAWLQQQASPEPHHD